MFEVDFMEIKAISSDSIVQADGLVLPFWQQQDAKAHPKLPSWAAGSLDAAEFIGASGQMAMIRKNGPARCVLLLGLGMASKTNSHSVVGSYAQAFGVLKNARCKTIALEIIEWPKKGKVAGSRDMAGSRMNESRMTAGSLITTPALAGRIASQVVMADYAFDKYKPVDKDAPKARVDGVVLRVPAVHLPASAVSVSRAALMGEAANLTRALQNEPANVATPSWVAAQATKAARAARNGKLSVDVLGRTEMARLKMNALLAVSSGSAQEPQLVVMRYRGAPSRKGWDAAVVGKGVTFDSGGISIKPASKMDEMKFDKSGACATIGIMSGCAELALPLNVVGVAALVENMPGGKAYRPGDIITACNGTTIEVLNTDAEGRVVLADALAYAAKTFEPAVMVDLATLTGACAVALGDIASGILSEDDGLVDELVAAGERCGERLWRLPLWPEYDDKVKSEVASVKNMGEPGAAGATAGASFLKAFAGERPWAHIDIAGTAYGPKPKGGLSAGGYGLGVRLVLEFLSECKPKKKDSKK